MSDREADRDDFHRLVENAKKELENMIDLHPQGMFLLGADGAVVRANAGALSMLGLSEFREILGRSADDLFRLSGDDPASISGRIRQVVDSGLAGLSWETSPPGAGGRPVRFRLLSGRTEPPSFMLIAEDLGGEEAELRQREKEQKRQAAEALAGTLNHVLNQPLAVIMGRAQLLLFQLEKGRVDTRTLRNSLREIVDLSRRIADTLSRARSLRDFSTVHYLGDTEILDLDRSASREGDD